MYKYIRPHPSEEIGHIYAATIVPLPTTTSEQPPLRILLGKHDGKDVVDDNLILSKDYNGLEDV